MISKQTSINDIKSQSLFKCTTYKFKIILHILYLNNHVCLFLRIVIYTYLDKIALGMNVFFLIIDQTKSSFNPKKIQMKKIFFNKKNNFNQSKKQFQTQK